MKWVTDRTGRFVERPYYDEQELEAECELLVSDFLGDRHGKVEWPVRTDDLTVLIESRVSDLDLYADLTTHGPEVEGVTLFTHGRLPQVKIAASLSGSPSHENRLRTTLTHELGHVHFHSCLFDAGGNQAELFGASPSRQNFKGFEKASSAEGHAHECRRETILEAKQVDWMEWQAGFACGAFLMPRSVLKKVVREYGRSLPDFTSLVDGTEPAAKLVELVVQRFAVSSDAARVRLLRTKALLPEGRGIVGF